MSELTEDQAKAEIMLALGQCDAFRQRLDGLDGAETYTVAGATKALQAASRLDRDIRNANHEARRVIPVCRVPAQLEAAAVAVHDGFHGLGARAAAYLHEFRKAAADAIEEAA